MGQSPFTTVVIAAYNAERTISATLRSLSDAMTYSSDLRIPVIVVDDGSKFPIEHTISSVPIAQEAHVVRLESNSGLWNARNVGVDLARTKYVTFVDADDIVERNFFDEIERFAIEQPEAIATRYVDWIESEGTFRSDPRVFPVGESQQLRILAGCFMPSFSTVRKDVFESLGGFRPDVTEDWDFWIRFFNAGHTAVQTDCVVYRYRIHAASLSQKPDMPLRDLQTLLCAKREIVGKKEHLLIQLSLLERRIDLHKVRIRSKRCGPLTTKIIELLFPCFKLTKTVIVQKIAKRSSKSSSIKPENF